MKTAISIPDPVFRSAEALARRLKMSRSQLYAKAVADFVGRHRRSQITTRLNDVYSGDDEGGLDTGTLALQLRSLPEEEW
jgi:predicted transcriptional regulator